MGIHCEISLNKSLDGVFRPGDKVKGEIKYAVDEETKFSKITISLKSYGFLSVKQKNTNRNKSDTTYTTSEMYVDEDYIVSGVNKETIVPIGSYQLEFNFELPKNVPASLHYCKHVSFHEVSCNIIYYVRIKFERPGILNFAKRYKKEITVVSGVNPQIQLETVVYGQQKTLTQLFSSKKNIVNLKASIENSHVKPGEKIKLNYELINDTNKTIKAVEINLYEKYNFTLKKSINQIRSVDKVKNTDNKTSQVLSSAKQNMDIEIAIPSDIGTLQFSKIVSRDYCVKIEVCLPVPHRNLTLDIPVLIGDVIEDRTDDDLPNDAPPSYWEAMGESEEDEKEKYPEK